MKHLQMSKIFIFEKPNCLQKKKKFISQHSTKFNDVHIKQKNYFESFYLNQKRLCKNLRLVESKSSDLTSAQGVIRKSVSFEDQYVAQRARDAYIATFKQSEATFDLSFVVQVIVPKQKNAKRLNKRIQ